MDALAQDAAAILAAALAADLLVGEPPARCHPVVAIGKAIRWSARRAPHRGPAKQLAYGAAMAVLIPTAVGLGTHGALDALGDHPWVMFGVSVFLLTSSFAVRGLGVAAHRVRDALRARDLAGAREGLRSLCSRPAETLAEPEIVGATVESVAENTCDSVVAPLVYFAIFGVPGALAYRALNTLDSMIGYHGKYEYLGKASARLDDVANYVPARLTALLFLCAGSLLGHDLRGGVRIWRRDGAATESPNAGRSMAVMAGLLRVRLDKRDCYRLGDPTEPLEPETICAAWRIAWLSMIGFALIVIGGHLLVR